jgi:cephalosporin-C deacetylase
MKRFLGLILILVCHIAMAQNNDVSLVVTSNDSTHAFSSSKTIQLISTISNKAMDTLKNIKLNYCIQTFEGKDVLDSLFSLPNILPNTTVKHSFLFNLKKPDFYISNTTLESLPFRTTQTYAFAIEPLSMVSPYPKPKDFKQFWVKTLAELQEIPPSYTLTPSATLSNDTMDVYSVEMRSLDNVRVQGWYVVPKGKRNLPALIYFQGYTTNSYPSEAYFKFSEYAQFFLNIRGHGDSRKDVNPGFGSYLTNGLKDRNTYIFRGAYMDCIRAVDFVCSRPEVNAQRIGIWGGSMGGALALITASLDRRVKLCVFDLPFLSDFRNYFTITNWPAAEIRQFASQKNIPMTEIYKTLDYFDIKNFAPWVQCPVMMGVGLLDRTCPPAINFAAFNNLKVQEKYFYLFPYTGHFIPIEHNIRLFGWFKNRL